MANSFEAAAQFAGKFSGYAGFGRRAVASLIDGFLLGFIQSPIFWILGIKQTEFSGASIGLPILIWTIYATYMQSSDAMGTIGKRAMGLVVTDSKGERLTVLSSLMRCLASLVSGITLGIGILIQPFTEKKQTLHDIIAGTLVFKK
jgi:uncharacterized RDD family membrane protein YckC